ncbi:uncharacterized protein LOC125837981 [Solanum verrucosum]|uniref:uncharacterized protein LOC125837981 n=1 Tax=Solanum verrucosum TaxID=315347 RepID=UPI0020D1CC15|nr:uncharacterized protein LOC125837981 [Solanum verrucosum]
MNPTSFTRSSTAEDPENFIEELKKVFDVMHVTDTVRVELATYQMKNVARTWFDQGKGGRAEDTPPARNESGQLKSNANRSSLQQKQKVPGPSSTSAPAPKNKDCPKNQQENGNGGNKAQSSSVALPDWASPRGATFGIGG